MSTRDFRATQVRTHAIIGSGSSPQLLLYPSASATNQYGGVNLPGTGSDTWMFVSGAIGTSGGKVVFGGDVIISGSVNAIGGGTAGTNFFSSTTTGALFTTGSAAFRGEESSVDAPADKGSDVFFYVSGTVGGTASLSKKSLFGGDVVMSGGLNVDGAMTIAGGFGSSGVTISGAGAISADGNLTVVGNTTIGGNLTVNGTTTTVNTTNLLVKDPLILIGSGAASSNANGGIALASGSTETNKSLVFGRVANDVWGGGKLDVTNGTTTTLAGMDLVGIRAGKFEIGGSTAYLTTSLGNTIGVMGTDLVFSSFKIFLTGAIEQGFKSLASTNYAVAMGNFATASNAYAFSQGSRTVAGAIGSHAQGQQTFASGNYSHAEGFNTTASGSYSHAEGNETIASGAFSHAEGFETLALGLYSHAEGDRTLASTTTAHSEGYFTTASAFFSHAEGERTIAAGVGSHAEGQGSTTRGTYSHAGGIYTIASGTGQTVYGKYNLRGNTSSLFVIGNGSGDADANRSDVLRVESSGLQVTGSGWFSNGISGSHTSLTDGRSFLVAGTNVTITSASDGQVTIASTGGGSSAGSATTVQLSNGSGGFSGADGFTYAESPSQRLQLVSVGASNVTVQFGDDPATTYFGIGVNPSTDYSLDVGSSAAFGGFITASLGFSGSHTSLKDGRSFLVAGTNVTIVSASDGQITISSTGGGGDSFFSSTTAGSIFTTGSAAFKGAESIDSPADKGADVFFYVSGAIGSRGTSTVGTAVFGGDVVISGTLFGGSPLKVGSDLQVTGTLSLSSESRFTAAAIQLSGSSGVTGSLVIQNDLTSTAQLVLSSTTGFSTLNQTSTGDLEVRNTSLGGNMTLGVKTSAGNAVNFMTVRPNGAAVSTLVSVLPGIYAGPANPINSSDTNFFVGGTAGSRGGANRGTSVFGGDVVVSGTLYNPNGVAYLTSSAQSVAGSDSQIQFNDAGSFGASVNLTFNSTSNRLSITGSLGIQGDILPDGDRVQNLGSPTQRWAHVYTGDLHLRNDRGDYTLIEEEEFLSIRFNKTGKRYRFLLEPVPHLDEDPNNLS